MRMSYRHRIQWVSGMLLLLLMACSHQDGESEAKQTMLRLYVYAPERPIQTRVNKGDVDATEAESTIHQLQVWVFRRKDGRLVTYFKPQSTDQLNLDRQETYLLAVPEWFGDEKSNVDVYVLANAVTENCGNAFDENTTRDELNAAVISGNFFGLSPLTSSVPEKGIPMSGILKNQRVSGKNPVLHIGEENQVATVRLARAVSKVRFVFSRSNALGETTDVTIKNIMLDAEMIPNKEYLFLDEPYDGRNYRVGTDYNASQQSMHNVSFTVAKNEDPSLYVYTTQESQEYEDLITTAVNEGKLTQKGPYYLRETDKKLSGIIKYQIMGQAEKTTSFSVKTKGDFSRNHTWIVYAFCGAATLEVITVQIQNWNVIANEVEHNIYNW